MAVHLLYDRPYPDQHRGLPALYITGTLPAYAYRAAYEGRLQIHNAIGACSVQQIAGDELPAGHAVWVDQDAQEIVVAWPEYQPRPPLANPGFDDGTTAGWTITTTGNQDDSPVIAEASLDRPRSGGFSAFWQGNRGVGHARGIEAVWENTARGICYPLQRVTAEVWIALDDTGNSQNRGRVRLHWYGTGGAALGINEGTLIRGNDRAYRLSTVSVLAPAGTTDVALAVWTTANYSGGVRFDDAGWDLPADVGTDTGERYCITLRVRDSAGRTADWSGCIGEAAIYLTSRPYASELIEAITAGTQPLNGRARDDAVFMDGIAAICIPMAGTLRAPLQTYAIPAEAITSSVVPQAGTLRSTLTSYTAQAEAITTSAAPLSGGTLKYILVSHTVPVEAITTACTPLGGTLT